MASSKAGAEAKGDGLLSIGEVSERFGIPVSTLRYYDRQGLFPALGRRGGQRRYAPSDLEALRVIECLKASGLGLVQIRRYMEAVEEGPATMAERSQLVHERREELKREMARLGDALAVLDYKCWLYDSILAGEDEEKVRATPPEAMEESVARGWRLVRDEMGRGADGE